MLDMILHAGRRALYLAGSMSPPEVWDALLSDEKQVLACCALIVLSLLVIALVLAVDHLLRERYLRTRDVEEERREQLELSKAQWQRDHERRQAERGQGGTRR